MRLKRQWPTAMRSTAGNNGTKVHHPKGEVGIPYTGKSKDKMNLAAKKLFWFEHTYASKNDHYKHIERENSCTDSS